MEIVLIICAVFLVGAIVYLLSAKKKYCAQISQLQTDLLARSEENVELNEQLKDEKEKAQKEFDLYTAKANSLQSRFLEQNQQLQTGLRKLRASENRVADLKKEIKRLGRCIRYIFYLVFLIFHWNL